MRRTKIILKILYVVAAIIIKNNKIFCTQRPEKFDVAKKWEFPGGKIEPGEIPEEALIREIKEELSSDIDILEFFLTVNHQYETFNLTMHCYKCTLLSDKVTLNEHIDSCWLPIEKLNTLDWAPADIPVVEKLQAEWRESNGKSN